MKVFRLFVGLVLAAFLPGVAVAFWKVSVRLVHTDSVFLPFLLGTAAGLVIARVIGRLFPTLEVFEHELTHALVALLLFRPVTGFSARRTGGYVSHGGGPGGGPGDDLIGLAPYLLPTFTILSALARPLLGQGCFPWFDGWIGLTFGYHTLSTLRETRANWAWNLFGRGNDEELGVTDIARRGVLYSTLFIATTTLAVHGIAAAVVLNGYRGVPAWGHSVWAVTKGLAAQLGGK